ncbi:MAG: Uma2 family endonuclease [Gemmataceae bacterium]
MSTLITKPASEIVYPSSDGAPLGETEIHFFVILSLVETLSAWFSKNPMIHVAGDLMLYYEEGNPYKFVSPDIQVTFGIPKLPKRTVYLVWKEGKSPDFVIEVSSKSTSRNDLVAKLELYRDVLHVQEYFIFDPLEEYLDPSFVGYALVEGEYHLIKPVDGRLPSKVTGLHLQRDGQQIRLYDPVGKKYLLAASEVRQAKDELETRLQQANEQAEQAKKQAEEREKRLRQEIEALRRQLPN